jgi:dolichol-phosphate mannosyltransferase
MSPVYNAGPMRVVIVLPTYNERDNIGPMLEALLAQARAIAGELHVLVVDDESPDGTGDVVRTVQRDHANVHLSQGAKAGLGAAYVRGFRHALGELRADVVMQMDADFSHDPRDVPRLVGALDAGADVVIGSRYVPGGAIPDSWGTLRRLNSRWGNRVARYLVGLHPVRDCTSGFRAIRASLLERLDLRRIRVQSYAFLVALLYEAKLAGARIVETPIVFVDRTRGTSKLGLRDILEFVVNAAWLRFRSSATFLRFLAVGATGIVVNLGAFTLLLSAGMHKYLASPIAIELSVLWNFMLHNLWTFGARRKRDSIPVRGVKFKVVSLAALAVSYGTFVLLSIAFPGVPPQVHQLAGIVPATLINYFLNAYWTFRSSDDRTPPA